MMQEVKLKIQLCLLNQTHLMVLVHIVFLSYCRGAESVATEVSEE